LPTFLSALPKDSILLELQRQPAPEKQVSLLIDLSEIYTEEPQYDSAYHFAWEAIKIAVKNNLGKAEAESYYALGYAYDLSGRLDEAVLHYENARNIYAGLDIKPEVANCMNAKGVAAYFKGDFEKALAYYLETLDYVEQHGIKKVMINTLNNLGVIYRITSKNQEAIDIYHKTLNLSRSTQNDKMVAVSFQNLGVAFNFEGIMDSALFYLDSALHHYSMLGDSLEVGHTYTAIGETYYLSAQNYGQARENLLKGVDYLRYGSSQEELTKSYLLLARIERDDGVFDKAVDYFQKGLALLAGTDREDVRLEFYKEMETCFHKYNRPDSAYNYLKK
jgi:tetratricopeptide (TPR) repeat protein